MDGLINMFYTQAFQKRCAFADSCPDSRLPIPVRFFLDDFASNTCIPDFDKLISVIRSRDISVSIIIQSLSQLNSLYGPDKAMTIINNCDHCLYLGGQDVDAAKYLSVKANLPVNRVLDMPLDRAFLFTRGSPFLQVKKYNIIAHPIMDEPDPAKNQIQIRQEEYLDEEYLEEHLDKIYPLPDYLGKDIPN